MKHIIVGAVAGGATAAARIRRIDESAEIVLIEKGKYVSYANCGLPYYIGGVIADRDNLFVQTPQSLGQQLNIDVRTETLATAIDPQQKSITLRLPDGSQVVEHYDKLLLSPGSNPVRPPLEGIDLEGIFTLRDVDDTDRIKTYLTHHAVKHAVVVGAGFIGLEMAENLHHAGAKVSIVEMSNQVMAPIDYSMAAQVHEHLRQKGVGLHLEQGVKQFEKAGSQIVVRCNSGLTLTADIVILSIGVRPNTELAKAAGLTIDPTGGIWVDEYLATSDPDIYAVGDAIAYPHPITGRPWLNYLANPANRQGRIVADNMVMGNRVKYEGAIGTSIAKVFDLTVGSTGLAAKRLKQAGIAYLSSWTHGYSHAGYYPDALPLSIKLTFDPESGRLYGAQCVGYDGVDKRIDQMALVIKKNGTVYDLAALEHAYAPPYSSAKDPVAIAGYVAGNVISGAMPAINWRQFDSERGKNLTIIDVRTADEYQMGHIAEGKNIPLGELRERLDEIPTDRPVVVHCAVGLRGYLATRILMAHGRTNVRNLQGGYKTYATAVATNEPDEQPETTHNQPTAMPNETKTLYIDACGLQCPGPVLKLKRAVGEMRAGERVSIVSTDPGFARDAKAWSNSTGNALISVAEERGRFTVVIEKGDPKTAETPTARGGKGKTLIMFSDDLDKALATFVLANGAAATGQRVTIFFTFWGLNVIKKVAKPKVEKDIFGKMFGLMLPSSSLRLKLSKMNMLGMGPLMMRYLMRRKGIESLESLRQQAIEQGVEFIACQMSMDVMGVKREELMDEASIGGVATYMERADEANVNLFI